MKDAFGGKKNNKRSLKKTTFQAALLLVFVKFLTKSGIGIKTESRRVHGKKIFVSPQRYIQGENVLKKACTILAH